MIHARNSSVVSIDKTSVAKPVLQSVRGTYEERKAVAKLESSANPPHSNGANGKADHQEKLKLPEKARAENPGQDVVQEKKNKRKVQIEGQMFRS